MPSDSTTQTEVDIQEAVAKVGAGGGSEVFGLLCELGAGHLFAKDVADFEAVAMESGYDDVGGLVVAHLHDHVSEVGLVGGDAGVFESRVELDLVGGHGLDLDDFGVRIAFAVLADEPDSDGVGFVGVAGPVDGAAGGGAVALEVEEIVVEVGEGVGLDGAGGIAELLPVGHLFYAEGALVTDDVGGVMDVAAELVVLQRVVREDGEG